MCHHKEDFNNDAEWVFSTTGHGKAAVDGMNGTLKREAANTSLYMKEGNTITSAEGFHQWNKTRQTARGEKSKVISFVITKEDIDETGANEKLKKRWEKARTVSGTQSCHSFSPDPNDINFLYAKSFYSSGEKEHLRHSRK